ncbi:hypothetical protein CsSME_00020335 [Camellia sinensis var. sinensis]
MDVYEGIAKSESVTWHGGDSKWDGFDQRRTLVNHLASMSTTQRFTSEGDCSHNPILGNTPTTCMEGVKWDTVHLWRHFSTPPTRSGGDISKGFSRGFRSYKGPLPSANTHTHPFNQSTQANATQKLTSVST